MEQCNGYWALLRSGWDFCCISRLGVQERGHSHDTIRNGKTTVSIFERPDHGFPRRQHQYYELLYVYLLSSRKGRRTIDGRCLSSAFYSRPDVNRRYFRNLKLVSPQMDAHLSLTVGSRPRWVLPTVRHCRNCRYSHWLWLADHIYSNYINRKMGGVPNLGWPWPWRFNPNSMLLPARLFNLRDTLLTFPKPLLAIQNSVSPAEIPVSMSLVIFAQTFFSSLFLSFAQTAFTNGLTDALPKFAPGVDVQAVVKAGASAFRTVVPAAFLPGVLLAFNQAVSHVFYLITGSVVGGFISSWGMGWKSIKKPKVVAPEV
jgi:hypothetical protein